MSNKIPNSVQDKHLNGREIVCLNSAHRITCKYSNAFQYSEPCSVAIRFPMPDPKGGLQSPCACQHQDIILADTAVLDHDLTH